jgi:heterotetrameric sarcosine oxidase gamma subunit
LHSIQVGLGAVFTEVSGWQMVERYDGVEDEIQVVAGSAGVCDMTGRTAVRVKSLDLDTVLGSARVPEIGSIVRDGDLVNARLTAEEVLVLGPPTAIDGWQALVGIDQIRIETDGEPSRQVTNVTSGMTVLRIVGLRARDVIASLTSLDVRDRSMPDGACAQAGFAEVHGTLLRVDIAGAAAFELYVAREFGVYVWEVVLESLGHDGVVPFGNEALRRLERGQ